MPPIRGCGSPPIVFVILVLLFIHSVSPASIPAPRCNARSNSTVKITVLPDERIRRTETSSPEHGSNFALRCNGGFNATANATVIHVGRIRRADKPSGVGSSGSEGSESSHSDVSSQEPAIDYQRYVDEGYAIAQYLKAPDTDVVAALVAHHILKAGDRLASRFTDVGEFRSNGWDLEDDTPELLRNFDAQAAFGTALRSLGVSDKARPQGKHEYIHYAHTLPWMRDGKSIQPVGSLARFAFITDPEDACLIITLAYSTGYWIREKGLDLTGENKVVSPPLSHKSDMAFLEWKRACTKYNTNPKVLKHIFLSGIMTDSTQQVVDHVFHSKMGRVLSSWSDLPLWDQRLTLQPNTEEFDALLATVQLKGIMWMLLQHREQLGKKSINKMCIFKDEITGVVPDNDPEDRGPSIYLELEDVQ